MEEQHIEVLLKLCAIDLVFKGLVEEPLSSEAEIDVILFSQLPSLEIGYLETIV